MKFSINWIREFCPFKTKESSREIGIRFTLATAEVENVEQRGQGLEQVVAARILDVKPHPDADQLRLARIELGDLGNREVVCGAPNARKGCIVPYAAPGVKLGSREVRVATIRGVESPGMLLSEAELGISEAADGLWELPPDSVPGTPISRLFPALEDTILEVDNKSLTHRPDLWGHYGIAREFSVIYRTSLRPYSVREELATADGDPGIRVEILPEPGEKVRRCRRYCGLRIDGVEVRPSPDWLRHRLLSVGLRPISNLVDITNYVMLELGQPMHAFDVRRIRGGVIRVRRASSGEALKLIDGSETRLVLDDLVIADAEGPVALAGVMGGEGTEISDDTRSVFLESANFDGSSVRRTSMRTVRTDSSARFEKFLDPATARMGILRAAALILEICPGSQVVGPLQDVGFTPPLPSVIDVRAQEIVGRLGAPVGTRKVRSILEGLGFELKVAEGRQGDWQVTVPTWRATKDISIKEDLVEEVGRVYGYDRIKPFSPLWPVISPIPNQVRLLERRAKNFLCFHGGLTEVLTHSMVGSAHCRSFGLDPAHCLALKNPMSADMDRMRREIVPIHLEKTRDNQRFNPEFGFFELGRVYLKDPDRLREPELPRENQRIAGIICKKEARESNFYHLRHLVLSLLRQLGARNLTTSPNLSPRDWIHPTVGARVLEGELELGQFYRIHPAVERRLDLEGETLAFDLDFDAIAGLPPPPEQYRRLPRFPFVTFDVAVEAPERTLAAEIESVIRQSVGASLRGLEPFDVYRGSNLPQGTKSIAFHIEVGADDHTLPGTEAEGLRDGVIEALKGAGFRLRS